MKKIWVLLFFVIVMLLSGGIPALAFSGPQTELSSPQRAKTELAQLNFFDDPTVDKRITELQRRIDAGKRSGQLTSDEASRLQASLDGFKAKIAKYRNDGFMSRDERAKANEMLTALEERVRAERTDDDVAHVVFF